MIAAHNPAEAARIASGAASGVTTDISAIGRLFTG